MDNYLYFCTECNKLFKVADTGRKVKCSHCSKPLADLEITDTEYAALDPDKREALKNKAREGEKAPEVREPAVQTPEENTGMPETDTKVPEAETKAPETETKVPEAETKAPDVVPPTPANDVKKSEEKPRSSGLFDINALLYGGAGGDPVPETPPVSAPPVDINAAQNAAQKATPKSEPEPEPSAPPMDINALLKATPEPAKSAPSTDINALLKATPEPEPSAPPTDINALLKATPEPEPAPVPAPAPDVSADTNTGADTDINKNTETDTNTETEADTNTDTDINTDSISAFFDIGDSFKDPYMSEGGSDDEDDNAQENTAEDTAGQDSPIPSSPIPSSPIPDTPVQSSPIPDNTISDSMIRSSAMAGRIAETGAQLTSEIEKQSDEIIAVRNNYLKIQIQNQLLAVDNFMSICKLSALQDDGVVDKDEEKLLKRLEKVTSDYKKALNRLV